MLNYTTHIYIREVTIKKAGLLFKIGFLSEVIANKHDNDNLGDRTECPKCLVLYTTTDRNVYIYIPFPI